MASAFVTDSIGCRSSISYLIRHAPPSPELEAALRLAMGDDVPLPEEREVAAFDPTIGPRAIGHYDLDDEGRRTLAGVGFDETLIDALSHIEITADGRSLLYRAGSQPTGRMYPAADGSYFARREHHHPGNMVVVDIDRQQTLMAKMMLPGFGAAFLVIGLIVTAQSVWQHVEDPDGPQSVLEDDDRLPLHIGPIVMLLGAALLGVGYVVKKASPDEPRRFPEKQSPPSRRAMLRIRKDSNLRLSVP